MRTMRTVVALILAAWTLVPAGRAAGFVRGGSLEDNRTKILAYVMRQQLPRHHYSHKEIDDELSRSAFALYLKQLDFQKRFLLAGDVARLRTFQNSIDDEINLGTMELPSVAYTMHRKRVVEARGVVRDLLGRPFDPTRAESVETDPEKLDFCDDETLLRERWRRNLKYQVMNRFLNLEEDQQFESKNAEGPEKPVVKSETELRTEAREKTLKTYEDFFSRLLKDREADYYDRYFNAVARAFDPHTNYMPPERKEDFDISMRGSLEGIGALLREEDGFIKVVRVIPGSAAWRQGDLQGEDIILKVAEGAADPVDVTDMKLRDAVGLIRGKKGTEVRLTVKHSDGVRSVIPIIRDVVEIEETFVKSAVLDDEENKAAPRIGYVKIPSFYRDFETARHGGGGRNSTDDVRTELERLRGEKVKAVVLDLRSNGGGALADAVNIAGLFFDEGPVVQVKSSNGRMKVLSDTDPTVAFDGPVVVLVNKFSASASEILAGALQDYGRAIIMGGEHTHGKGTVQSLIDMNRTVSLPNLSKYGSLGALKVTIQKFYRVSGASTQYRGVVPDIIMPDRFQHLKTGEQYLEYSLPWDTVDAVAFRSWPHDPDLFRRVEEASEARIGKGPKFIEIAEASEEARKRRDESRRSLRLDDIRRERDEADRKKRRDPSGFDHGGATDAGTGARGRQSEAERREAWLKQVREDPYVREASAVLRDLLSDGGRVAGEPEAIPLKKM